MRTHSFVLNLITRSLILALAILFVVCAFLPIVSIDLSEFSTDIRKEFGSVNFKLSAIDVIELSINNFQSKTERELRDSSLAMEVEGQMEQAEEILADYERNDFRKYESLSGSQKALCQNLFFNILLLIARSESVPLQPIVLLAAILSLLFLLLAIAFLVIALLSFMGALGIKVFQSKKMGLCLYILLSCVPLSIIGVCVAVRCFDSLFTATAALIVPLVFSLCLIVTLIILRIIFERVRYSAKSIVLRVFVVLFAVILLCLPTVSILKSNLSTIFQNASEKKEASIALDASVFGKFHIGEPLSETYDSAYEKSNDDAMKNKLEKAFQQYFKWYSASEIKNGGADLTNIIFLESLLASCGSHRLGALFAWIPVFMLLCALFALLILQQNTMYFLSESYSRGVILLAKIGLILFAVALLSVSGIFLGIINGAITRYTLTGYTVSISPGIISFLVFVTVSVCLPSKARSPHFATSKQEGASKQ